MTASLATHLLPHLVGLAVQPAQDTNQDGWWKWVAIGLIALLVVSVGTFAVMILRTWVTED